MKTRSPLQERFQEAEDDLQKLGLARHPADPEYLG